MTTLTGTGKLVRLILRRDRLLLPLWILSLCLVLSSFPSSLRAIMPTAAQRLQYADNAGFIALYGRLSGTSLGEFVAWRAGFIPVIVGLISLLTVIRHTRVEEETGRRELLGATVVGRLRWAASHLTFSVLGPTIALGTAGLAAGLTHGLNTGHVGRELPRVLGAAMVQLPAVWVMAAIAVALFGLLPRLVPAAWGALALCLLVGLVGAALQLRQWLLDLSPFSHIPKAPGAAVPATPLVWLVAAAVALAAAGLVGLRRRDIPAT